MLGDMSNTELHVVFGAGGNIGRRLVAELHRRGERVRAVSRSGRAPVPEGVEVQIADALDPVATRRAAEGADVIYHCIGMPYPQWVSTLPGIMENLIAAAAAAGDAGSVRLVYADNLYAHGQAAAESGPLTENSPDAATGPKGRVRAELTAKLLQAHDERRIRAAAGRGSDFFGPGGTNSILHYFAFPKILAGKPVSMFSNPEARHSYIYLPDFVNSLITLGERAEAWGHVWNLPHAPAATNAEFIRLAYQAAGVEGPPALRRSPRFMMTLGGLFSPMVREVKEVAYQQEIDWVVDSSAFEQTFGTGPTPLQQALAETIAWYRERRVGS